MFYMIPSNLPLGILNFSSELSSLAIFRDVIIIFFLRLHCVVHQLNRSVTALNPFRTADVDWFAILKPESVVLIGL